MDAVALTHLDVAGRHPLRVCRAYQVGGQPLARIVPAPERDLRWQEQLTRTLLRARPVYDDSPLDASGRDWPGIFEEVLGAPVVLRSYGPTVADKRGATRPGPWSPGLRRRVAQKWGLNLRRRHPAVRRSSRKTTGMLTG